jgi:hypothetical protein
MPPFSSSVGERKIMNQFVVNRKTLVEHRGGGCAADQLMIICSDVLGLRVFRMKRILKRYVEE